MTVFNYVGQRSGRLINRFKDRFGLVNRIFPAAMLTVGILALPAESSVFKSVSPASTPPIIEIIEVVQDDSVTIRTHNFPADATFTATMGPMGTRGINGVEVGTLDSGNGESTDETYVIPDELQGSDQISIRLQSAEPPHYYAYNWFYNNTSGESSELPPTEPAPDQPPATPDYTGITVFKVISVSTDTSATIETYNFPSDQIFKVTMGLMGTRGIDGIEVGTLESENSATITETYSIPEELQGETQIAIRAQTAQQRPYYAYNWFWNNDATIVVATGEEQSESDAEAESIIETEAAATTEYGIPVISITSVIRDESVTFQTHNYPAGQSFSVLMAPKGFATAAGYPAGSFDSDEGGSFQVTLPIPPELAGTNEISIGARTAHAYPYYSYNWFYNNSTPEQ